MASNPLAQLQRRKKEIQRQLADLQKELKEIEKVERGVLDLAAKLAVAVDDNSDDEGSGGSSRMRSGARPTQIIKAAKEILLNSPHPMSRSELLKRLTAEGVEVIGTNPANTLGTTLSRAPTVFTNLKGFGYWLVDRAYGPASYSPDISGHKGSEQENEVQPAMHH